jgi:tetratricopeptide (TPR) repeat protein
MDKNLEKKIKEADSLLRENKASKAVTVVKEAIKDFPENAYLYYLLGIARIKCCRFFLAKRALEKADKLDPKNPENLRSLGWVRVMLGNLEEGRTDLRNAISLDLVNPLAYLDLAMSYFHFYEFEEGLEWLNRAKALASEDPYILSNSETAEKMKKEAAQYSKFDLKLLKKEKLNPKTQQEFRFLMLTKFFKNKTLTKDEMEEIKEELELNGSGNETIIYKDDIDKNMTKESVLKKRKKIEKKLLSFLKNSGSDFTSEEIKEVIYNERSHNEFSKIISVFDKGQDSGELKEILQLLNNAWNYFPHKRLGGLCPMEKILEHQKKEIK